jgi:phosphatidylglycerophosphate synthase
MHTSDKEYEASLKSLETENYLDCWFYRPIGFRLARMLRNTGVTPNMITILSIFVGAAAGALFYSNNRCLLLLGILSLVVANILDCVDGQLARLSGIKSEIGRILDGFAGDVWFIIIYVSLAMKLKNEYGTGLFFLPASVAGVSHLVQANVTDYYKTLHLYFVSKEKGGEFRNLDEVRAQYRKNRSIVGKVLFFFYVRYTSLQESVTPRLQGMLGHLRAKYGDDLPDDIRRDFRRKSERLMKGCIDFLTFNGRTLVLFIVVLVGHVWIYFLYEILLLNIVLVISIYKHERICASFTER